MARKGVLFVRNLLILADLTSPLMLPRITMLKELPYKKYILHNANNIPLSEEILKQYEGFEILVHKEITSLRLRYLYSFFYTLYLLITLNPKLIVVHWASRLYQNILLALWGRRVIVHTMGGEINAQEDCYGKKKFFTGLLFRTARIVTGKTEVMQEILLKNFPFVCPSKVKIISWGVEERFFDGLAEEKKTQLQLQFLHQDFDYLFFSVRTFKRVHFHKEILREFISSYRENPRVGLLVSTLGVEKPYFKECQEELNFKQYPNIILFDVPHKEMHNVLKMSDCVVSYKLCDGISQSLMEAVATKCWVISKRLKNHSMLLCHKKNAYLIDNVEELQEAFDYVMRNDLCYLKSDLLAYSSQKEVYLHILSQYYGVQVMTFKTSAGGGGNFDISRFNKPFNVT